MSTYTKEQKAEIRRVTWALWWESTWRITKNIMSHVSGWIWVLIVPGFWTYSVVALLRSGFENKIFFIVMSTIVILALIISWVLGRYAYLGTDMRQKMKEWRAEEKLRIDKMNKDFSEAERHIDVLGVGLSNMFVAKPFEKKCWQYKQFLSEKRLTVLGIFFLRKVYARTRE